MVGFIYILYDTLKIQDSRARPFYVRLNVCPTLWPNMCKIFASLLHDAIGVIKLLPPLRCMTLLGPAYFVYSCERREFVLELDFFRHG